MSRLFIFCMPVIVLLGVVSAIDFPQLNGGGLSGDESMRAQQIASQHSNVYFLNSSRSQNYGNLVQLRPHQGNDTRKLSIDAKKSKEIELSALGVQVFSQKDLYDALIRNHANVDADMAIRMKNNNMTDYDWGMIEVFAAALLPANENFKIELTQYKNFEEIKRAFKRREQETGYFDGAGLLGEPNAYVGASFDEIKEIVDSGVRLPDDALVNMVYADNINLAEELIASGYSIRTDYLNKSKAMSAVEVLAEQYAINPYGKSAAQQFEKTRKLLALGVPMNINDGTRGVLDIVLEGAYNYDGDIAEGLMQFAKDLNSSGAQLDDSGYEVLNKIKAKSPVLYDRYASSLK